MRGSGPDEGREIRADEDIGPYEGREVWADEDIGPDGMAGRPTVMK